jgi:hypothetical protein
MVPDNILSRHHRRLCRLPRRLLPSVPISTTRSTTVPPSPEQRVYASKRDRSARGHPPRSDGQRLPDRDAEQHHAKERLRLCDVNCRHARDEQSGGVDHRGHAVVHDVADCHPVGIPFVTAEHSADGQFRLPFRRAD